MLLKNNLLKIWKIFLRSYNNYFSKSLIFILLNRTVSISNINRSCNWFDIVCVFFGFIWNFMLLTSVEKIFLFYISDFSVSTNKTELFFFSYLKWFHRAVLGLLPWKLIGQRAVPDHAFIWIATIEKHSLKLPYSIFYASEIKIMAQIILSWFFSSFGKIQTTHA